MSSYADVKNCQTVNEVNSDIVAHMYDIWVSNNDLLIYTDWKNKSVNMLSLSTGTLLRPLATGLMRPSQLLFVGNDRGQSRSYCFEPAIVLNFVTIEILLLLWRMEYIGWQWRTFVIPIHSVSCYGRRHLVGQGNLNILQHAHSDPPIWR